MILILDMLGTDRRHALPSDTLHGQLLFPTFSVAPVIWISRGYRDHLAWKVPSCHLYRVVLLAVSPFALAPVQLLPYAAFLISPWLSFSIARFLMPAVCIHLPRCVVSLPYL